ncbi:ankyrin repeat domain-containing protein [Novipirellula sp.]|uniref:ankyrin repeat domain-containing protein n=1 Tax=Novipirellula sp. TaxID=2795430 RepID=UPI003563093F
MQKYDEDGMKVVQLLREDKEDEAIAIVRDNSELLKFQTAAGYNLLSFSAKHNRLRFAKAILELGSNPNEASRSGSPPLSQACLAASEDFVKLLLVHGADPNLDRTLFSASRNKRNEGLAITKLLIEYGVDVNAVFLIFEDPNNRKTSLDYCGDPKICDLLMSHGAKRAADL